MCSVLNCIVRLPPNAGASFQFTAARGDVPCSLISRNVCRRSLCTAARHSGATSNCSSHHFGNTAQGPCALPRAMPHVLVNEEPGSSRTKASPVRNAFGGHVIGSTARLRRLKFGRESPLKIMRYGKLWSTQSETCIPRSGSRSSTRARPS
jgi:hypothetical protein